MFKRLEKAILIKEEGWDSDSGSESEVSSDNSEVEELTEEELKLLAESNDKELNKELKCELCEKKKFNNQNDLDMHLKSKKHMLRKKASERGQGKKKRVRVARAERRKLLRIEKGVEDEIVNTSNKDEEKKESEIVPIKVDVKSKKKKDNKNKKDKKDKENKAEGIEASSTSNKNEDKKDSEVVATKVDDKNEKKKEEKNKHNKERKDRIKEIQIDDKIEIANEFNRTNQNDKNKKIEKTSKHVAAKIDVITEKKEEKNKTKKEAKDKSAHVKESKDIESSNPQKKNKANQIDKKQEKRKAQVDLDPKEDNIKAELDSIIKQEKGKLIPALQDKNKKKKAKK